MDFSYFNHRDEVFQAIDGYRPNSNSLFHETLPEYQALRRLIQRFWAAFIQYNEIGTDLQEWIAGGKGLMTGR